MCKIKIKNLNKIYNKKTALSNINLEFNSNKIYGLLGNNGAGKTTLINIITNKVFKSSGIVSVDNLDCEENEVVQSKIFCITEKSSYPNDLTISQLFVWENVFYSSFNIDYAKSMAKKFNLDVSKKLKSLSTGYYTILKCIITIASNCEIMIFDEPVIGIDSLHRDIFYNILLKHHSENKNLIIISTHLIDEVEQILSDLIILYNGTVIKDCPLEDFIQNDKTLNKCFTDLLKEVTYVKKQI
ncbi:MAG: ATP-binding cassette domain-containing protein [Oscillospiraceae bacterium]